MYKKWRPGRYNNLIRFFINEIYRRRTLTSIIKISIPIELKKELEKLKIDYSEDIRKFLEEKVRKKKMQDAIEKLMENHKKMPKLKGDFSTKIIREMRDRNPES